MNSPIVSVVVATYNSSYLLRYAISSVLLSDLDSWELIVVGDHCTDDTEACVASFGDRRIRFVNLKKNSGQQATPNNIGVGESRGEYIAFLNQDDMYLNDHLSGSIEVIRRTGADIVCSAYAEIKPNQIHMIEKRKISAKYRGFPPSGLYSPRTFQVASSWLLRRQVAEEVGPWKLENETYVTPSQDWLFRAWRKGKTIQYKEKISLMVVYSGQRKGSYRRRQSPEHEFLFRNVVKSCALRHDLLSVVESSRHRMERKPTPHVRKKLVDFFDLFLIWLHIHPDTPRNFIRWGGPGGYINHLKKFTG